MSRMQNWLVDGLNHSGLTPTTARNSPEFYLLDRQRLIMWQRRLYEQIDSAVDLLLFSLAWRYAAIPLSHIWTPQVGVDSIETLYMRAFKR